MPCTISDSLLDGTGRPVVGALVAICPISLSGVEVNGAPMSGPYPAARTSSTGTFTLVIPDATHLIPTTTAWVLSAGGSYLTGIPANGIFTIGQLLDSGWTHDIDPPDAVQAVLRTAAPIRTRPVNSPKRTLPFTLPAILGNLPAPAAFQAATGTITSQSGMSCSGATVMSGSTVQVSGTITSASAISGSAIPPLQLALVFNYHDTAPPNSDENGIAYVWGSSWATGGASLHGYYMPWSQAIHTTVGGSYYTLAWFQANHPDWLMYQSDQTTLATYTLASGHPPCLDFSNPAVQQWAITNDAIPALQAGYSGICWDDNPSYNLYNAVGHFDSSNTWVAQYSGAVNDTAWSAAQGKALTAMATLVTNSYPAAFTTINNGYFPHPTSGYSVATNIWDVCATASGVSGIFDEAAFSAGTGGQSVTGSDWTSKMAKLSSVAQSEQVFLAYQSGFTVTAKMTTTYNGTTTVATARASLQWALANYFLCRGNKTGFFWAAASQYGYGIGTLTQDEYTTVAAMGVPTNTYYASQNVYMRDYSNGRAIVNPDPTNTYSVTLPSGVYKDLYGNQLNSVSLASGTGIVLLKV